MRKLCLFIVLLTHFTAIAQVELRIDPAAAIGCSISQLFEKVDYIPLETSRESIFGKIDQLYVTDLYYIILDNDTNSFLLFLKNGKFYSRMSCGPKNQNDGARFFVVDNTKKQISVGYYFNKIKIFDFEGHLIETQIPRTEFQYIYPLGQEQVIYYAVNYDYKKSKQDTLDHELKFMHAGNTYQQFFPFINYNHVIGNDDLIFTHNSYFFDTGIDGKVTFVRHYDFHVYTADSMKVQPVYNFIFPLSRSLPIDFSSNPAYYKKRFSYINNDHQVIFGLSFFYQLHQLLFFKLDDLSNKNTSYVYDLSSSTLIGTAHIESDSTNSFLPVFGVDTEPTFNFNAYSFLTTDGSALYAYVSSQEMFSGKTLAAEKNVPFNNVMKDYFNRNTIKSNPVIVRLQPRSQFQVL
ncbi:6-bladed beta-propeller protein [Chitinophaga costaii]|uniref:6-bladed beta-propeller protein n=1 Tax=Chitinophaga costaii TaxID=1335309 RepID=A0A1C3YRA8_9BACT|nr:6-bladed beta-propeller [Chitinophaga costaii]PUZ30069.1 hypothetical protein DCM91_00900 [Chitinophaga costaii]SCB72626.1 6-bladed beta-propeller protein [Chitinophaga costaii]